MQLASAQLAPRIIATVFADRRLDWVPSIFTFAYTYTIAPSGRIDDTTPMPNEGPAGTERRVVQQDHPVPGSISAVCQMNVAASGGLSCRRPQD